MNIQGIANAYNSLRMNPENAARSQPESQAHPAERRDMYIRRIRLTTDNVVADRGEMPVRQEQPDRYIRSMNVVRNAIYDVSDVHHDRIGQIRKHIQDMYYYRSGDKTVSKIVDILLSMGKKNLSIFREEV